MLSPRWRKVIRDLLSNKTRTVLVVLSIAIGVFSIGMIGGTQLILTQDMREAFLSINPSSAQISTDPFDDELEQTIRSMKEVKDAQGRRNLGLRARLPNGTSKTVQLSAFGNFDDIRINKIFPYAGRWSPNDREVMLEKQSLEYLGLKIGDTLTLDLGEDKTRSLRIIGTATDLYIAPPMFVGAGYGYVSLGTLEWLGASRNFNQLDIVVAENALDKQHIQQVSQLVRDRIEKSGRTVYYTYVGDPGKHPIDGTMQALILILGALGVIALLLSGFLVVNTVTALLTQQTRQIGVMKAVGGRAGQIMAMYLVMVFTYGLLALLVGIPLGALGGSWMGGFIARLVGFDVVSIRPSRQVLLLEVAVGLAVPLLAALWPVFSGTRISAREAMSTFNVGKGGYGRGFIDRLLERVRGLSRPLLLSLRNTFRRKGRLALTLLTLTLGGATFMAIFSVRESTVVSLDDALSYFAYDYSINLNKYYRADFLVAEAQRVPGVVRAETIDEASMRPVRADGSEGETLFMLSVLPDTELIHPNLIAGRWLLPKDENAVVLNTAVTDTEPNVQVGDDIVLKGGDRETTWKVVGIARSVMTGAVAYANRPYFEQEMRTGSRAAALWVVTERHDPAGRAATLDALKDHFKSLGVRVVSSQSMAEQRELIQGQFDIIIVFLLVMAALMAVVGGLGLAGTMSLNVLERTREIGVMRAIGASDGSVRQIFIVEGILIGVLSWFVGAFLALPISQTLSYSVGMSFINAPLTYAYSWGGVAIWLVTVIILAALASVLPARGASRLSVREVLAYE
ncbi:MAG: FtsX-like permease family protein [Chloroflexi bacterium]|nr:FtsX-like permease family protein [Bacteroidota bacterium]MCL5109868.1 FtsX-like permease family protein [Chloroflexota bacterium]MDA8216650.1 FtsX-like permease family protein [Dehalococcoidales bacterium]